MWITRIRTQCLKENITKIQLIITEGFIQCPVSNILSLVIIHQVVFAQGQAMYMYEQLIMTALMLYISTQFWPRSYGPVSFKRPQVLIITHNFQNTLMALPGTIQENRILQSSLGCPSQLLWPHQAQSLSPYIPPAVPSALSPSLAWIC